MTQIEMFPVTPLENAVAMLRKWEESGQYSPTLPLIMACAFHINPRILRNEYTRLYPNGIIPPTSSEMPPERV